MRQRRTTHLRDGDNEESSSNAKAVAQEHRSTNASLDPRGAAATARRSRSASSSSAADGEDDTVSLERDGRIVGRRRLLRRCSATIAPALVLVFLLFLPCVFVGWGVALWFSVLATHRECDMTWMQPHYVALPSLHHSSRYALYKYHDARDPRPSVDQDRVPSEPPNETSTVALLYVPGHGGSYQQARSIGAHVLGLSRKRIPRERLEQVQRDLLVRSRQHRGENATKADVDLVFDVYSLDFREEPTALHGRFVAEQADFVGAAVRHLQMRHNRVVVVAHSFGGYATLLAVARHFCADLPLVITLGTPHLHPVLSWDGTLRAVHRELQEWWAVHRQRNNSDNSASTEGPIVVSLSGGWRDELIPPRACRPAWELGKDDGTSPDLSWTAAQVLRQPTDPETDPVALGVDHRALVWCHNLLEPVLDIVRAFFDLGEDPSPSVFEAAIRHRLHLPKEDYLLAVELQSATLKKLYGPWNALALKVSAPYNAEWLVNLYACAALWHWAVGSPWHWLSCDRMASAVAVAVLALAPPLLATQAWAASRAGHLSWTGLGVLGGVAVAFLVGVRALLQLLGHPHPGTGERTTAAAMASPPASAWEAVPLFATFAGIVVTPQARWASLCLAVVSLVGASLQTFGLVRLVYSAAREEDGKQPSDQTKRQQSGEADRTLTLLAWVVGATPFLVGGELVWTALRRGQVGATLFRSVLPVVLWASIARHQWRRRMRMKCRSEENSLPPRGAFVIYLGRLLLAAWGGWCLFRFLWTPADSAAHDAPPLQLVLVIVLAWDALEPLSWADRHPPTVQHR